MKTIRNRSFLVYMVGGSFLAFCAAAVNVHCIRATGYSVSHLTGDIARIPLSTVHGGDERAPVLWLLAAIAASFVAGAVVSGAYIHHPRFALRRPYGRALLAVAALLLVAALMERSHLVVALALTAGACGLQNSMTTHYRGLVLRTTHVTGVCTDFGQLLGMRLAGHDVELWKLASHAGIFCAFVLGGIAGYRLDLLAGPHFMLMMAVVYGLAGGLWMLLREQIIKRLGSEAG